MRYTDPSGHRPCGDGEEIDCEGNSQDPDEDPHPYEPPDDSEPEDDGGPHVCNMNPCPPVYQPGHACNMYPCPGTSQPPYDDFTGFWELDHLDGGGLQFDISAYTPLPLIGVDFNFGLIYNANSGEISLFWTPSLMLGFGLGGSGSLSVAGVYNAPNSASLKGGTFGAQVNLTDTVGAQAGYSYSDKPNADGTHAQTWSLGPSGGLEGSLAGSAGWTFRLFNFRP